MTVEPDFDDYYGLLQVSPDCDARILEIAYHYFAKMYHPDNPDTGDTDRFNALQQAYGTLKDAEKRADYDRRNGTNGVRRANGAAFRVDASLQIDESSARADAEAHAKILFHLYQRRRNNGSEPGVAGWLIQEMLDCSLDQFEFYVWYLKNKRFLEVTEQGTLAITVEGVDHVIETSRARDPEKLMIAKPDEGVEQV